MMLGDDYLSVSSVDTIAMWQCLGNAYLLLGVDTYVLASTDALLRLIVTLLPVPDRGGHHILHTFLALFQSYYHLPTPLSNTLC